MCIIGKEEEEEVHCFAITSTNSYGTLKCWRQTIWVYC